MAYCSSCGAPIENVNNPYCSCCGASNAVAQQPYQYQQIPSTQYQQQPALQYQQQPTATYQQAQGQPQVFINNQASAGGTIAIPPKNKWVAFVLCLFLGMIGVHCFYTGKIGMGVLYFFTLGLFGIGWIIDIIRILVGGYYDKWGRQLLE
jgi:TM2 domain-containing membrane protein YozV